VLLFVAYLLSSVSCQPLIFIFPSTIAFSWETSLFGVAA